MNSSQIIKKLKSLSNPKNVEGMARFGINPQKALGINIPVLRKMAKEIGKDHNLALQLWDSDLHEVRILATMIDEPDKVSEKQMEEWVKGFNSWDLCDQCCMNLFSKTSLAWKKAIEWVGKEREFTRRASFSLIACLAWYEKQAEDKEFLKFFPLIKKYSTDERNFVKKAVNWALRQIGKKNKNLNKGALKLTKEILKIDNKTAKWIASDALRELSSQAVQKRLSC